MPKKDHTYSMTVFLITLTEPTICTPPFLYSAWHQPFTTWCFQADPNPNIHLWTCAYPQRFWIEIKLRDKSNDYFVIPKDRQFVILIGVKYTTRQTLKKKEIKSEAMNEQEKQEKNKIKPTTDKQTSSYISNTFA